MKRTQTIALASLALMAALSVAACKKPADNTADNTPAASDANAAMSNAPMSDSNAMMGSNAMAPSNAMATNSPS
jgi:hypothetical protein